MPRNRYWEEPVNPWKDFVLRLGVVLIAVMLLGGVSTLRTVPVGHVGIDTSFGAITGKSFEPGLHVVAPWHKVHRIDNRIKNVETSTECFSKDLQLLQVRLNILTVLPREKAATVFSTVGPEYLNQIVPRVFEVLKQEIARYTAELVVENREKIRADVLAACRTRLSELVDFQDVVLNNIDFSDAYEKAIELKQVSQQQALQAKYELEKAKIESEKAIATAQGEAESIRIKGEALKESPGMAQLEAIRKWNGVAPSTIVLSGGDAQSLPVVFPVR